MGDIVTSPYGDSVVKDVRQTPFGFQIFDIEILASRERQTVNRISLSKITDIEELSQEVSVVDLDILKCHFYMYWYCLCNTCLHRHNIAVKVWSLPAKLQAILTSCVSCWF